MKKVFLVERLSRVDYDEFDSCVIIADSAEEVNEMIAGKYETSKVAYWDKGISDRKITEINLETCESMELCSSFIAG